MVQKRDYHKAPSGSFFARHLAKTVSELRLSQCITMAEAAARSNGILSPSGWANVERGSEPRASKLLGICIALKIVPDDLIPEKLRNVLYKLKAGHPVTVSPVIGQLINDQPN